MSSGSLCARRRRAGFCALSATASSPPAPAIMPRLRERSTLLKSFPRAPGRDRLREGHRSRPDRGLVRGRGPDRAEEQDHPALGTTRHAALGAKRSAHRFHLYLRRDFRDGWVAAVAKGSNTRNVRPRPLLVTNAPLFHTPAPTVEHA